MLLFRHSLWFCPHSSSSQPPLFSMTLEGEAEQTWPSARPHESHSKCHRSFPGDSQRWTFHHTYSLSSASSILCVWETNNGKTQPGPWESRFWVLTIGLVCKMQNFLQQKFMLQTNQWTLATALHGPSCSGTLTQNLLGDTSFTGACLTSLTLRTPFHLRCFYTTLALWEYRLDVHQIYWQ